MSAVDSVKRSGTAKAMGQEACRTLERQTKQPWTAVADRTYLCCASRSTPARWYCVDTSPDSYVADEHRMTRVLQPLGPRIERS